MEGKEIKSLDYILLQSPMPYYEMQSTTFELDISTECGLQSNFELRASFLWKTPNYLQLIKS